jgi:peptide/nickel transport system ATP-binding protein
MSQTDLLRVQGLSVHAGSKPLLADVSFSLQPGDVLTLLGESGAGKSLLAQAVMGNLSASLRATGSVTLNGRTSRADDTAARRGAWGRFITLLPQEPTLALDPLMRLAPQLAEVHTLVRGASQPAAKASAQSDLAAMGLPDSARQYPWQLSGGMAQRAAATIARAGGARVVLADEPTKGLDDVWRNHTVKHLQQVQLDGGCLIVITHDLRVARALGGQLLVLRNGEVVEQGQTQAVLAQPKHTFTRQLLAADPCNWLRPAAATLGPALLTAQHLQKSFAGQPVLTDLSLQICAGQTLAVQGPSGSGKSTLGNLLIGLMPPDSGSVVRAAGLASTAFQKLYQDPTASFAPLMTLAGSMRDVAKHHGWRWPVVLQKLATLGIPEAMLLRRPHQVSGGELQRIALARALLARPVLLFADEPTSRLDPLTQQEAIGVLLHAMQETQAALVLVTHDKDLAHAVGSNFIKLGNAEQV